MKNLLRISIVLVLMSGLAGCGDWMGTGDNKTTTTKTTTAMTTTAVTTTSAITTSGTTGTSK